MNVEAQVPDRVLLFSGHMIDAPGREKPRFPPVREAEARQAIAGLLIQLSIGPRDLAVCSGACGGDLLFAEAALDAGTKLEIYLPFDLPTFARESVAFAGGDWYTRFETAVAAAELHLMPDERDPLGAGQDPYEQINLWMLEAASRFGAEKVNFVCLWNGEGVTGAAVRST